MSWHLKDRELEKKLIEICPNFLECIEFAIQTKEKDADYIYVEFDRERVNVTLGFNYLYFWDDELEEVHEYNPKAWNEYPKVKPVEPGIYRLEVKRNAAGVTRCYAAVFDFSSHKNWYIYGQGCLIDTSVLDGGYVRYRPWSED